MSNVLQFDYNKVAKKLIDSRLISAKDIYYFHDSPIKEIYEGFFQWCMEEFKINNERYNLTAPCLIFIKQTTINAYAQNDAKFQVIQITRGLIDKMHGIFFKSTGWLHGELAKNLEEHCRNIGRTAPSLTFELFSKFVFLHELAHLLQGAKKQLPILQEKNFKIKGKVSLVSQLREFDADILASYQICLLTVQKYHTELFKLKIDSSLPTDPLISFLALLLAGILAYFLITSENTNGFYLEENTHPHPYVRLGYIVEMITLTYLGNESKFGKIDKDRLGAQFTEIAHQIVGALNSSYQNFDKVVNDENKVKELTDYIAKLKIKATEDKNLTINFFFQIRLLPDTK